MNAVATPFLQPALVRRRWAKRNAWTIGVYVLLAAMLLFEKRIHPELGSFDMQSLVIAALPLAFAAMGQATIVIGGGIDLSIGPMMSLVNVIAASSMIHTDLKGAILISVLIIVGTSVAGALTGAVINITRVPDIIVTLATSFIWTGVALLVMLIPGGGAPLDWINISTGLNHSIPTGVILLLIVFAVTWIPFSRSRPGLSIYSIGSNRNAAFLSGVSVPRARITAYAMGGVFIGLAGLALTASGYGSGNPHGGEIFTLNSVAAVVLGGVSLMGGRGGLLGPMAAAFILSLITPILTFMGQDPNFSTVLQGIIVVLIVMIAGLLLVRRRL